MRNSKLMSMSKWKLNKFSREDLQTITQNMIEQADGVVFKRPLSTRMTMKVCTVRNGIGYKSTMIEVIHELAPKLILKGLNND